MATPHQSGKIEGFAAKRSTNPCLVNFWTRGQNAEKALHTGTLSTQAITWYYQHY